MKKRNIIRIKETLISAVIRTFSDMAFIDVEVLKEIPEELTCSHIIHISLSAPEHGEIALFLPSDCKRMIVENIYGSDWTSLNPTEIDDCLLEILNVLAGNFLTEYFGAEVKLNMIYLYPNFYSMRRWIRKMALPNYFLTPKIILLRFPLILRKPIDKDSMLRKDSNTWNA